NRITQKLQLFVVGGRRFQAAAFEQTGFMGERPLEQPAVVEAMAKYSLQCGGLGSHGNSHVSENYLGAAALAAFFFATSSFLDCAIDFTCGNAFGAVNALSNASFASSSLSASR